MEYYQRLKEERIKIENDKFNKRVLKFKYFILLPLILIIFRNPSMNEKNFISPERKMSYQTNIKSEKNDSKDNFIFYSPQKNISNIRSCLDKYINEGKDANNNFNDKLENNNNNNLSFLVTEEMKNNVRYNIDDKISKTPKIENSGGIYLPYLHNYNMNVLKNVESNREKLNIISKLNNL